MMTSQPKKPGGDSSSQAVANAIEWTRLAMNKMWKIPALLYGRVSKSETERSKPLRGTPVEYDEPIEPVDENG